MRRAYGLLIAGVVFMVGGYIGSAAISIFTDMNILYNLIIFLICVAIGITFVMKGSFVAGALYRQSMTVKDDDTAQDEPE
jgi:hypothetical protein